MRKTKNKWKTDKCPSCGEKHSGYTGKINKSKEEYVVCGLTGKVCRVINVTWQKMDR